MYAVFRSGEVLLVGEGKDIKVGSPLLAGSSVSATVLKQGKSKKVTVVKFRRRQNYLRQHTHRQFFTEVEITGIGESAKKAAAPEAAEVSCGEEDLDQKGCGEEASQKEGE